MTNATNPTASAPSSPRITPAHTSATNASITGSVKTKNE